MKRRISFLLSSMLLMVQGAWAQDVEPSLMLTEIKKTDKSTVYTFNFITLNEIDAMVTGCSARLRHGLVCIV